MCSFREVWNLEKQTWFWRSCTLNQTEKLADHNNHPPRLPVTECGGKSFPILPKKWIPRRVFLSKTKRMQRAIKLCWHSRNNPFETEWNVVWRGRREFGNYEILATFALPYQCGLFAALFYFCQSSWIFSIKRKWGKLNRFHVNYALCWRSSPSGIAAPCKPNILMWKSVTMCKYTSSIPSILHVQSCQVEDSDDLNVVLLTYLYPPFHFYLNIIPFPPDPPASQNAQCKYKDEGCSHWDVNFVRR